jgi:hypothetical protein
MEVQTRLFLQRDFWVKSPHTAQGSVQHPNIRHSYYWRRGGHLKVTKTEGSAKPLPMR